MPEATCRLPACDRPSRSPGGLCEAHHKRRQRGQSLDPPVRQRLDPAGALLEAALAYADAPSEDDLAWWLARERLLVAAKRYARAAELEARGDTADLVPRPCETG